MGNLIEQAALRLEQLRKAGMATGADAAAQTAAASAAGNAPGGPVSGAFQAGYPIPAMPSSPAAEIEYQSEMVELDLAALEAAGFVVPKAQRTRRGEEYRVIKRPLILNATGRGEKAVRNGNLIMVSSALPGEGKSFTSLNLALSIAAELDHTVLLVDADVARPSMPRMLGLDPERKGLLDVLNGEAAMAEAIVRTNVPKLSILPSGKPRAYATEMLGSESMSRLLEEMAGRYSDRIIIFDSPPLLLTTESRVLASHMGQLVMVVEAGQTLRSEVKAALATVENAPVRMLVLNKAVVRQQGDYSYGYGYGDGYGYGYGYGYGSAPAAGTGQGSPMASGGAARGA